jgi:hypothetical protein
MEDYYSVNLTHVKLMVFDYYKDCVVEGNKKEICSKIQNILNDLKSFEQLDSENEERINFITHSVKNLKKYSFHTKRAFKKENEQDTPNTNNIVNNQVDEKKLIERQIFESLNKHKDELPIKRLKIFSSLSYIIIYQNIPAMLKEEYISLIKGELVKIFIEN